MQIFPQLKDVDLAADKNLAIQVFGKRIYEGQTLYEYLLEFLLIFLAPKAVGVSKPRYEYEFPEVESGVNVAALSYFPTSRMGLKRFIFFERSKNENKYPVDRQAYADICKLVKAKTTIQSDLLTDDDLITVIQDLFYGFNAVIRNRSWFVQSLLPICPEVILPETMGKNKARADLAYDLGNGDVDTKFETNGHYFMARGGEVYFLHVLQGLFSEPELKEKLEFGLKNMVESFQEFSELARWIQDQWQSHVQFAASNTIEKKCQWIPAGYARRSEYTVSELVTFLETNMDPFQKIDVLAHGIVLQILRMMHEHASSELNPSKELPVWIIDLVGESKADIRKTSVGSYASCEETLYAVLHTKLPDNSLDVSRLSEGAKNSHKLFRKLGKEIGLVVPPKGSGMRFSLSETLVQFLVLSVIPSGKKLSLDSFLEQLYMRYRFVIGPRQMLRHSNSVGEPDVNLSDFEINLNRFQLFLKKCGFLRDLSDATSIVVNPFTKEN